MKKLLLLLVIALCIGLYFCTDRYGIRIGTYSLQFDANRSIIARNTEAFLRAIQFKDFAKAATLHSEDDQGRRNIPKLLENKFHIKHELIDMRHFEILRIDMWPEGNRAKSVNTVSAKLLNSGKLRDVELILYWKKTDERWYLDLQSSL